MKDKIVYDVLIVAAGMGLRAKLGYNKTFFVMKDGKNVIDHSISLFRNDEDCKNIIVVTNKEYFDNIEKNGKLILCEGGEKRSDSVANGLAHVKSEYVMIHDGARPYLSRKALELVKEKLKEFDAVCLGKMATDTIKKVEGDRIIETIDRRNIFHAETPQAFKTELIRDCYDKRDVAYTDDASLAEANGYEVRIVIDPDENSKLTLKDDFRNI